MQGPQASLNRHLPMFSMWALLVALAVVSATPANADTQVFAADGSVSPETVQEDATLPAGIRAPEAREPALARQGETSRAVFQGVPRAAQGDLAGTGSYAFASKAQPQGSPLPRGTYWIQQSSSGRYVDAYQTSNRDFTLVTRSAQNNTTQLWELTPLGGNLYTIRQRSSGRYVDAHQTSNRDFTLVTRPAQNNASQHWEITPLGGNVYTIRQRSSGRYVDAHQTSNRDFTLVTRPAQNNASQHWVIRRQ